MEKAARIEELRILIEQTKKEVNYYNALQLAVKLVLNGTYGAFGNAYFVISNQEIAGAITAMGRDLIQYMVKCNDEYWYELWHNDTELHEKMGVEFVDPIDPVWIHYATKQELENPTEQQILLGEAVRKNNVSAYADTDSLFVSFLPAMKSCGWEGELKDFVFKINEYRLASFFQDKLKSYAAQFNVENIQDFELERINESALFLAKKLYVQHVVWEDGIHHDRLSYLFPKGVQLVKGSTPPFVREKVKEIIKYLFAHPEENNVKALLALVKDIKRQFMMCEIEDISMTTSCSNYEEMVIDDTAALQFRDSAHYNVKMAALHNYLLYQNPECKNRYNFIKSGVKFKWYHCQHPLGKHFAYVRGEYPKEFAPPVDYDVQFEKTILAQVNEFVTALGMPELKKRLSVVFDLFGSVK